MKLTKYEHACLVAEQDGRKLVVDPGAYSTSLGTPEAVAAIVITHEHPDHLDVEAVKRIVSANPDAKVIAHESLAEKLQGLSFTPVAAGSDMAVGPFHLEFFGGQHAQIHPSIPTIANLGVMINDTLYYPGDSFANPDKPVNYLAVPAHAPWMKFAEAVDFLDAVKPESVFPTHDAFLSDAGHDLTDRMFAGFAQKTGARYERLQIGETIEI